MNGYQELKTLKHVLLVSVMIGKKNRRLKKDIMEKLTIKTVFLSWLWLAIVVFSISGTIWLLIEAWIK